MLSVQRGRRQVECSLRCLLQGMPRDAETGMKCFSRGSKLMLETFIVVLLSAGLWGIYTAMNLDPEMLLFGGLWIVGAGFALGLPTGAIYHYVLFQSLRRVDALPARWWLRPTTLHDRIPQGDRIHVLGWCYAGAAGFLLILIGIAITASGALQIV